ncbi:MAG: serine hydrolase domain-containing protein [Acutalibacteraceae bacterium]|nr:serine hydrolase domain-containing protein [Acutalibacteraceae bacterium]
MKLGVRIAILISFFVLVGMLVGISVIQTEDPTSEQILPVNNENAITTTEAPTRPPEPVTERISSAFSEKKLEALGKTIDKKLKDMEFNGTFLVAVGDEILYHKAMGYSDVEKKKKNTLNTKYEIGSCSKQFTAAAIAKLEQAGKLSLNDNVSKYIDSKIIDKKLKVYHLINMCSGLPDYLNEYIYSLEVGERDTDATFDKDEFIKWLDKQNTIFTPGEYFSYSNTNYYILGLIIEKVTGKTYEQYLEDEIFYPLYMDDSSLVMTDTDCEGYLDRDYTEGIKVDSTYFYSAGEIVSTTTDMLKWLNAYSRGKVLDSSTFNKAINIGKDGFNYGYGWFVCEDYYYHTGNTELFYAIDIATKKNDIKVIGLSNVNDTSLQQTGLAVLLSVENQLFPGEHNVKPTEKPTKG